METGSGCCWLIDSQCILFLNKTLEKNKDCNNEITSFVLSSLTSFSSANFLCLLYSMNQVKAPQISDKDLPVPVGDSNIPSWPLFRALNRAVINWCWISYGGNGNSNFSGVLTASEISTNSKLSSDANVIFSLSTAFTLTKRNFQNSVGIACCLCILLKLTHTHFSWQSHDFFSLFL